VLQCVLQSCAAGVCVYRTLYTTVCCITSVLQECVYIAHWCAAGVCVCRLSYSIPKMLQECVSLCVCAAGVCVSLSYSICRIAFRRYDRLTHTSDTTD